MCAAATSVVEWGKDLETQFQEYTASAATSVVESWGKTLKHSFRNTQLQWPQVWLSLGERP